jgi:hypothetical protein
MGGINSCLSQIAQANAEIERNRRLVSETKEYLENKTYLVDVPRSTLNAEHREANARRDLAQFERNVLLIRKPAQQRGAGGS